MRALERTLWLAGALLLGVCLVAFAHRTFVSRRAMAELAAARAASSAIASPPRLAPPPSPWAVPAAGAPDTRLWSAQRLKLYEQSGGARSGRALAVLRIPKIALVVPVLEGTDELTLNAAVGHIEDTARPGEPGNVGIAGHRDGFFRGLKDVSVGDEIDLDTPDGTRAYAIDSIRIVDPDDVAVLDPTTEPVLSLVSCYPFYFVGPAPKRFVVRARLDTAR